MTESESKLKITAASLQPELWTCSSNEAVNIFVTYPDGKAVNFHPTFTYPIFGDSEQIFGYQDLTIFLCFDHYTFYPFLNVKFAEKLEDNTIEDPKEEMLKFLPQSTVFKDESEWLDEISKEKQHYKIPGELVGEEFVHKDSTYAIYKINLRDTTGLELHQRLQILSLLFIEAASYIDYQDELWELYVLYRMDKDQENTIVGFCTAYNYWKYNGHQKFDEGILETRKKISQFIVLPPYSGQLLGGTFYTKLFETWLAIPEIVEIVVEDPNESFDDLRDRCDLSRLATSVILVDDPNLPIFDSKWTEDLRIQQKLEKRQFSRLLEMLLLYRYQHHLSLVPKNQIRQFIKRRLYAKNKDVLESLDKPTFMDKLQTAYDSLEQDYMRILEPLKLRKRGIDSNSSSSKRAKK